MNSPPKVSVLMVTYNQEAYIAQAVSSALMQRTDFPVEVVVGEDCSTDATRSILLELQKDNPDKLRLLLHSSNIGGPRNVAGVFAACRGGYVAMLEGDDYWTSPHKLQKQVEALDAHPEWAMCFHPTRVVHENGSRPAHLYPDNWSKPVATIDDLFHQNFMSTCSVVFRNRLFGAVPAWHSQITPGDWVLHILNADHGNIGFIDEVMADYRVHGRGVWMNKSLAQREAETLRMLSLVDHHFQGKYTRQIDEYRIGRVTSLLGYLDDTNARIERLQVALARAKEQKKTRSAAYNVGRAVMRPLERFGRRCVAALGRGSRAA